MTRILLLWWDLKTLLFNTLTFAFGIRLNAKPDIRTPSVHYIKKSCGKVMASSNEALFWLNPVTYHEQRHFMLTSCCVQAPLSLFAFASSTANVSKINLEILKIEKQNNSDEKAQSERVPKLRSIQSLRILNFVSRGKWTLDFDSKNNICYQLTNR